MGEVRGVLNVDADREDAFSEADQELLEALAVQAAKVIHNTWLFEQSRLKARLLETLASVSQTINSTLNLNEALPIITREACTLMEAKMASIMMLDESGEFLELRASYGAGEAYLNKPKLSLGDSFLGLFSGAKSRCNWKTCSVRPCIKTWTWRAAKDWFRC